MVDYLQDIQIVISDILFNIGCGFIHLNFIVIRYTS